MSLILNNFTSNFSLISYFSEIKPLLLIIFGILVYSFFIFKFYKFLATRDILKLELHKHARKFSSVLAKNFFHILLYIIENIVLIPICIFFGFVVLAIFLLIMSKTHSPETLILVSLALVASVRVSSYYSEELAKDLAKLIPLTLLGIFVIDYVSAFSLSISVEKATQFIYLWKKMLYYIIFVVLVELVLRIIMLLVGLARGK